MNFRQFIDSAIGSPEPGHVNFYALHFLLLSFAEKLNLIDEPVDKTKYENISISMGKGRKLGYDSNRLTFMKGGSTFKITKKHRPREVGGADPEEPAPTENPAEAEDVTEPQQQSDKEEMPTEIEDGTMDPLKPVEAVEVEAEAEPVAPNAVDDEIAEKSQSVILIAAQRSPTESLIHTQLDEEKVVEAAQVQIVEVKTSSEEMELAALQPNSTGPSQMSNEIYHGISVMKDQLELTMEQVRILSTMALDKKPSQALAQRLRSIMIRIQAIQQANYYIESANGFRASSFAMHYDTLDKGQEEAEEREEEKEGDGGESDAPSSRSPSTRHKTNEKQSRGAQAEPQEEYDLDVHLCYAPEKLLDQLLDLKSEFCLLTNKVNEITASLLEQDCQRTTKSLTELHTQMNEMKGHVSRLKEFTEQMESKQASSDVALAEMSDSLEEIMQEKIDKSEMEILLADKVDYGQLKRKASQEQLQEMQCRFDKKVCEMRKQIETNDKNMYQVLENMRTSLGLASVDDILNRFKEKMEADIRGLQETLRKYIDATNDECAAAGARIKVLQDLACISCDTTCVMRTMETAKVPKLPSAHATATMSPLITYEISSIRKSGIMGYYRKDDFPHAPSAWLNQKRAAMKTCVPRHAGGAHTTHTAKEHFEKVIVGKK